MLERLQTAHHRLAIVISPPPWLAVLKRAANCCSTSLPKVRLRRFCCARVVVCCVAWRRKKYGELTHRIAKLTENLPPLDEMTAPADRATTPRFWLKTRCGIGRRLCLRKQCEVCHQMAGEGKEVRTRFGWDRRTWIGPRVGRSVGSQSQCGSRVPNNDRAHRSRAHLYGPALRDEGKVLLLVDSEGNELRIPHDEIDEQYTSALSPMPNALDRALTEQEFNHLVRFLLTAIEPLKPLPDQSTSQSGE